MNKCKCCGGKLEPVWYIEKETQYNKSLNTFVYTGRKRQAVDFLQCECCGHKEAVDEDYLAESWE